MNFSSVRQHDYSIELYAFCQQVFSKTFQINFVRYDQAQMNSHRLKAVGFRLLKRKYLFYDPL